MIVDTKDIIESKDLEDGFVIFHNNQGFFLGVRDCKEGIIHTQKIDRETYNSLYKREGNKV